MLKLLKKFIFRKNTNKPVLLGRWNYSKQNLKNIYANYDQRVSLNLRIQQTHKVNIKTFDILGRHVNTIYSGDLIRGEHEFSISHDKNGKLSAGQYFYRINLVGGPTLSKAFVVR